jgi:hypothetical protein
MVAPKSVRYGMTLADGKSASLAGGQWAFPNYSADSWIGKANAIRLESLKIAQRIDGINKEMALSRVTGISPKCPDTPSRQALLKKDRLALANLRKQYEAIEIAVDQMAYKLQPYDYDKTDARDAMVAAQLRTQLLTAKDDKARAELLAVPEYRRAAFEAPPQASGILPAQYERLKAEDTAARWPVESATIKDWDRAGEVVATVFKTVDRAINQEATASGLDSVESAKQNEGPAEAAWA